MQTKNVFSSTAVLLLVQIFLYTMIVFFFLPV